MKRKRLEKHRRSGRNYKSPALKLWLISLAVFFVLVLITTIFVSYKVLTLDKFIYVTKVPDGAAEIIIIDPTKDKIVKYKILSETELDSARGYGNYKLSSLWQLSEKDEMEGQLISETITKNYLLPVYLWKNGKRSNLTFFQKIKSSLIEKKTFEDSQVLISTKLSNSVLINFMDTSLSETIPTIDIEDLTGNPKIIEKLSSIIEVIGGKITTNSKGYDEDLDCQVSGKDKRLVDVISKTFDCEIFDDVLTATDLKISLGVKFIERF